MAQKTDDERMRTWLRTDWPTVLGPRLEPLLLELAERCLSLSETGRAREVDRLVDTIIETMLADLPEAARSEARVILHQRFERDGTAVALLRALPAPRGD